MYGQEEEEEEEPDVTGPYSINAEQTFEIDTNLRNSVTPRHQSRRVIVPIVEEEREDEAVGTEEERRGLERTLRK